MYWWFKKSIFAYACSFMFFCLLLLYWGHSITHEWNIFFCYYYYFFIIIINALNIVKTWKKLNFFLKKILGSQEVKSVKTSQLGILKQVQQWTIQYTFPNIFHRHCTITLQISNCALIKHLDENQGDCSLSFSIFLLQLSEPSICQRCQDNRLFCA